MADGDRLGRLAARGLGPDPAGDVAQLVLGQVANGVDSQGESLLGVLHDCRALFRIRYQRRGGEPRDPPAIWCHTAERDIAASQAALSRAALAAAHDPVAPPRTTRSEERRVGKEGRSRWSPYH